MRTMIGRLGLHITAPVITVGGTNGKGSTCTFMEAIAQEAGLRVALYTSPHLVRFTERARICGREVEAERLAEALGRVERVRGGLPLSYFEFTTLGILLLLAEARPDLFILEVGLGGRMDAVNAIDPDVSVITSIGIDHVAVLGRTREAIAREKAGILRSGRPGVCAEPDPPETLLEHAREIGAPLLRFGEDFSVRPLAAGGCVLSATGHAPLELHPGLEGGMQHRNAAAAVTALRALSGRHPEDGRLAFPDAVLAAGVGKARLTARFERIAASPCLTILDVGHNPEAAEVLARNLAASRRPGERTLAVVGMLSDKDRAGVLRRVAPEVTEWFCAGLSGPRGGTARDLARCLGEAGVAPDDVTCAEQVADALELARARASELLPSGPVRLLVFGSFHAVEAVLAVLAQEGVRC